MAKKVYLMLSGGVDSSVAASVLKDQGYDVTGVYMKCWSKGQLDIMGVSQDLYACNWEDDIADAELVSKKLNIPFLVWDFQKEYREKIVQYMIDEYKIGRTPNPDVMCNSLIKFGIFYEKTMQEGADFVATGHYAKIINSEELIINNYFLAQSPDPLKDQSYFLWRIKKEQLARTLLPIGEFKNKTEVRNYALEKNLITADKKDSQGLCFIGKTSLRDLLLETIGQKQGQILSLDGKVLGKHTGAFLYTIGQRNGLGLSGGPWFVTKIDVEKNIVYVTDIEHEKVLFSKSLLASDLNLLVEKSYLDLDSNNSFTCASQTRYHQEEIKCRVKLLENSKIIVDFEEPVKAVSKGQSIVLIKDSIILGGAIID